MRGEIRARGLLKNHGDQWSYTLLVSVSMSIFPGSEEWEMKCPLKFSSRDQAHQHCQGTAMEAIETIKSELEEFRVEWGEPQDYLKTNDPNPALH